MGLSGWNLLPEVPGALNTAISRAVRKAAIDIQRIAMQGAPIKSGFLKGSIYTVTHSSSGYAAAAGNGTPPDGAEMLPEVPKPPNDRTAYVAVGASYGIYQEFGTVNMPAHPYLTPAAEMVRPEYEEKLRHLNGEILSLLGGGGSISTPGAEE